MPATIYDTNMVCSKSVTNLFLHIKFPEAVFLVRLGTSSQCFPTGNKLVLKLTQNTASTLQLPDPIQGQNQWHARTVKGFWLTFEPTSR